MNANADRHKKRMKFLKNNKSSQERLEFLRKHTHDLSIAVVGLHAELQPDGWKSVDDEGGYKAVRTQKASIIRHLRAFSDAAKELDKLHIFGLSGIDRIVGSGSVTSLSDAVAHGSVENVQDDALRECIEWLLEKERWDLLGMIMVCDGVQPKGSGWNNEFGFSGGNLHLAAGDVIPRWPSLLLAIDEDGTPHALIVPLDGSTPVSRHCDKENLAKANPEFSEIEILNIAGFDGTIGRFDDEEFVILEDNRSGSFDVAVQEMRDGFYGVIIQMLGRGDVFILGNGQQQVFAHTVKKIDGTPDDELVDYILRRREVEAIIRAKGTQTEPDKGTHGGVIEIPGKGAILFLENKQGKAISHNVKKADGSLDNEFVESILSTPEVREMMAYEAVPSAENAARLGPNLLNIGDEPYIQFRHTSQKTRANMNGD